MCRIPNFWQSRTHNQSKVTATWNTNGYTQRCTHETQIVTPSGETHGYTLQRCIHETQFGTPSADHIVTPSGVHIVTPSGVHMKHELINPAVYTQRVHRTLTWITQLDTPSIVHPVGTPTPDLSYMKHKIDSLKHTMFTIHGICVPTGVEHPVRSIAFCSHQCWTFGQKHLETWAVWPLHLTIHSIFAKVKATIYTI